MRLKLRIALALSTLIAPCDRVTGQTALAQPEITIRVAMAQPKVAIGDPIRLVVSITNSGKRGVFIGRNLPGIQSDPAYVSILISGPGGTSPEGTAFVADRFTTNSDSFANAIMKTWIAIPPNCTYSFPIAVREYAPDYFRKTGTYKIQAIYKSSGIRTQILNQRLSATEDDIKKLPFAAWEGQVASNEVSFNIAPR